MSWRRFVARQEVVAQWSNNWLVIMWSWVRIQPALAPGDRKGQRHFFLLVPTQTGRFNRFKIGGECMSGQISK
jgi:hypothetical protein